MKFLVSIALLLLVTGCGSANTRRQATPAAGNHPEPGKGLVIFYRERHFEIGARDYAVRDFDEKPKLNDMSKALSQPRIGGLPNGSYFVYQAAPGEHSFGCSEFDVWEFGVGSREYLYYNRFCRVNIESNMTYYIRLDFRRYIPGQQADPGVRVVGSPQGSEAIKSLKCVTLE